jgi:hypothetical protein
MDSFAKVLSFPEEHFSKKVSSRPILDERRLRFRYPLDLRVRFQSSAAGARLSGAGLAVNVSSGGVFVASNHPVTVGALVEMSIDWPSMLDGTIPLQLVAVGRVLRRGVAHFAASFDRHEFRTLRSPSRTPDGVTALLHRRPRYLK